jgi:hypothetical protein
MEFKNATDALEAVLAEGETKGKKSKKIIKISVIIVVCVAATFLVGTGVALKTNLLTDRYPEVHDFTLSCRQIDLSISDPDYQNPHVFPVKVFLDKEDDNHLIASYEGEKTTLTYSNSIQFPGDTEKHKVIVWARDLNTKGENGMWVGGSGTLQSIHYKRGFTKEWDRSACE